MSGVPGPWMSHPWASHPVYAPFKLPLELLLGGGAWPDTGALNAALERLEVAPVNATGRPIRFVAPAPQDRNYEIEIFESGRIATRSENWHDLFNALSWMAFPRTKAALNALHAAAIPGEAGGRRSRLRDLLTLFDEGGAVMLLDPSAAAEVANLVRACRWRELFWTNRERLLASARLLVIGHAVLDMARTPWPGITCKVLVVPSAASLEGDATQADGHAALWLKRDAGEATPRELPTIPVFGFPGWLPQTRDGAFYQDERYFRPFRRPPERFSRAKITSGVGQTAAAAGTSAGTEESPGSAERDAG